MRPVRDISTEENFRTEQQGSIELIRRDPVEPEPVGTIVLMPFRITGYDSDCDGSLMPRLQNIDSSGERTVCQQSCDSSDCAAWKDRGRRCPTCPLEWADELDAALAQKSQVQQSDA